MYDINVLYPYVFHNSTMNCKRNSKWIADPILPMTRTLFGIHQKKEEVKEYKLLWI
jgi:hypothetical protein